MRLKRVHKYPFAGFDRPSKFCNRNIHQLFGANLLHENQNLQVQQKSSAYAGPIISLLLLQMIHQWVGSNSSIWPIFPLQFNIHFFITLLKDPTFILIFKSEVIIKCKLTAITTHKNYYEH